MRPDLGKPRFVLVTRQSRFEALAAHHGTAGQARFRFEMGAQAAEFARAGTEHQLLAAAVQAVEREIPADQRRVHVDRAELHRFLFAPDDVIVVIGQDGLVPNAAKYLTGQLAVGINPDPNRNDGVLCPHTPADFPRIAEWLESRTGAAFRVQQRVMAHAVRDDGLRLLALNEVFAGHRSHQTAKYRIRITAAEERQFSSGLVCATGTGCTGWARSISEQWRLSESLPQPEEPRLAYFVREPFPSVSTGTSIQFGFVTPESAIHLTSEMGEGGVLFADGIEDDRLEFLDGQSATLSLAPERLNLVVPARPRPKR